MILKGLTLLGSLGSLTWDWVSVGAEGRAGKAPISLSCHCTNIGSIPKERSQEQSVRAVS